jgi:hypothetical protein
MSTHPPEPDATHAPASDVRLKSDIVVIGAGQAGLSSAYHLKRRGVVPNRGFVVLDQSPNAGGAWQFRWPSLTLSTVNRIHDLPGMPFSDAIDTAATEVEAAVAVPRYFAAYEKAFDLPVYRPVKVTVVCDRGDWLNVETDRNRRLDTRNHQRHGYVGDAVHPGVPGRGPLRGTPAAHARLPVGGGVRREARHHRRRRHLGDPAARRDLARHHDDVDHEASAGIPHRPVR